MNNKDFFITMIKKRAWFFSLSLVYIIITSLIAIINAKGTDILWMVERRSPALNQSFLFITKLGEEWIFIIMILLQSLYISYRQALSYGFTAFVSLIIAYAAKAIFQMPRPLLYFRDLNRIEEIGMIPGYEFHSSFTSFPSGHTIAAFSFFVLVALFNRQIFFQILAFICAGAVGISRIYLGQHFSGDVAAGAFLGVIISISVYYITHVVMSKYNQLDQSLIDLKSLKN